MQRLDDGEADPRCTAPLASAGICGGILRPTTILFEEMLDPDVLEHSIEAVENCDLLVTVGTLLTVHPAAGLVPIALGNGIPVIIINRDSTPYDDWVQVTLGGDIQEVVPALFAC